MGDCGQSNSSLDSGAGDVESVVPPGSGLRVAMEMFRKGPAAGRQVHGLLCNAYSLSSSPKIQQLQLQLGFISGISGHGDE